MGERQWCPTDPNIEQKTSRKTSAGWGPFLGWGPLGPGFPIIKPGRTLRGQFFSYEEGSNRYYWATLRARGIHRCYWDSYCTGETLRLGEATRPRRPGRASPGSQPSCLTTHLNVQLTAI